MNEVTGCLELEQPPNSLFRLLVVEDERVAQELIQAILNAEGFEQITTIDNGQAALDELDKQQYHLVLVDWKLPDMDGLSILKQGKQKQPIAEFILITAHGSLHTVVEAIRHGAFGYINKPFADKEVIVSRVEKALYRVTTKLQNSLLLDRIRMILCELQRTEDELDKIRLSFHEPTRRELELIDKVQQAVEQLTDLSSQMERLRSRTKGSASKVLAKIGLEITSLAQMLSNQTHDEPDESF